MNKNLLKYEFKTDLNVFQCDTCLSVGRKLSPIGIFSDIYCKISPVPMDTSITKCLQLCWECLNFLRKIRNFQRQIEKVYYLSLNGEKISSFSKLTISKNTETINIVHAEEYKNITGKLKEECCTDFDETLQIDSLSQSVKSKSKWALKRSEENKKRKFKIIRNSMKNLFVKIPVKDVDNIAKTIVENQNTSIICQKCLATYDSESLFLSHNHECLLENSSFVCDICKNICKSKKILTKHIHTHNYVHKCSVCLSVCEDFKQHMRLHKNVVKCIKCGLLFGNRREFFKHYKEFHEKFTCDYCGISFKLKYCIRDHIRKKHSPYKCEACNKKFARYNGLWLHNKLVHTRPASPAYCVECDKHFDSIYKYKWHLCNSVVHKNRRKVRIPCPECTKVFTKKIYMADHYNLVHLKIFNYRCEQCNKNFTRNAELIRHNRKIHEGLLPPRNKICYICGRGFTTNKILLNHIRTHSGERPFKCEMCAALFTQRVTLNAHIRAKHNKINKQ